MMIKIFVTGGTLDKIYDEICGKLTFSGTHLPEMIYIARSRVEVDIETIMLIDSLEMTDEHRKHVSQRCKNCLEDRILITHGTDTIVKTARLLGEEIKDKSVVLTGAMVPYSGFSKSDALFNLGCALAYVQYIPYGVYVAMNGRLFNYDNVIKNVKSGEFETIK